MEKTWGLVRSSSDEEEFWREKIDCKWASLFVLLFILFWHTLTLIKKKNNNKYRFFRSVSPTQSQIIKVSSSSSSSSSSTPTSQTSVSIYNLQNGPLTYMSVTIFENCSVERLRDFYMDNEYRLQWDKTMVDHKQLQIDETNGTEVGRTVKKFPLLTPREYVLAWRLWEGKDNTFYCFTKECEHTLAPRLKKYVRVGHFRSGWRIRKVPGRNACEIKMVHQEDAGLNVEMAKLVFSKGIWSYVNKMDAALQKHNPTSTHQSTAVMTAVTLMQKVPQELDATTTNSRDLLECTSTGAFDRQEPEIKGNTLSRRPSKKMIANGLLLLGGVLCLSRGHSSLGAKIAMACILKKLTKHTTTPSQAGPAC
ncbi:Polyketide cyclase/dehydrase and lipid transport superfamily protein [Thalictrum thalictroides]|uniref:Polyketide cyclase/dehydrase and lipid transport superfamily protein n=1 Tax=Thalictrum thalictroides TaxID=46969 RepID=A0A7J6W2B2_THATH|nr:Polyketide cyclase/dehydrase and lipid transport superfamily protein [Thalictrum thalictroides]